MLAALGLTTTLIIALSVVLSAVVSVIILWLFYKLWIIVKVQSEIDLDKRREKLRKKGKYNIPRRYY